MWGEATWSWGVGSSGPNYWSSLGGGAGPGLSFPLAGQRAGAQVPVGQTRCLLQARLAAKAAVSWADPAARPAALRCFTLPSAGRRVQCRPRPAPRSGNPQTLCPGLNLELSLPGGPLRTCSGRRETRGVRLPWSPVFLPQCSRPGLSALSLSYWPLATKQVVWGPLGVQGWSLGGSLGAL